MFPVVPTFISSPENVTVLAGTQAGLRCAASAAPVSFIEWRKNEDILTNNSRYMIVASSTSTSPLFGRPLITTSNMTITGSHYTDAGIYFCRSINAVGQVDSRESRLVVQGILCTCCCIEVLCINAQYFLLFLISFAKFYCTATISNS